MKKRIVTFLLVCLLACTFCGQAVYAFCSNGANGSHEQFAKQSLNILQNDKGKKIREFYSEDENLLLEYCDMPDKDEKDHVFAYHFYNPYNHENYLPSKLVDSKITAMTKFKEHIKNAVSNYKSNRKFSIQELGRAIHFLEDVNVPHHAANLIAVVSSHSQYESYVNKHNSLFFINSSNAYNKYKEYNFNDYCTAIFNECAKNAYSYKDIANTSNEGNWEKAARPTIKLAQENISSLFYRFENEVNK